MQFRTCYLRTARSAPSARALPRLSEDGVEPLQGSVALLAWTQGTPACAGVPWAGEFNAFSVGGRAVEPHVSGKLDIT